MLQRTCLSALLALGVSACDGPDAPPSAGEVGTPHRSGSPASERPAARPAAPAAAERRVVGHVDWPDAASADAEVLARFGESDRRNIERSGVPVLAPRDPRVFASTKVVAKAQWFTIAMKDAPYAAELQARREGLGPDAVASLAPGLSLFVQGTHVAHRRPGIPRVTGRDQVRGRPAWITQNESIWSATWEEHGVSYVAEVECSRPTDARCQSPDVLVELTESLVFVGGAGPISATSDRALPEIER